MIEVTVKTLDGKNRAFMVPDEITVKQFKMTIAAAIEIKAEIQRLIFKGRILCDDHKINDYDVNGKTIHVVQKLPPSSVSTASTAVTSSDPLPARSRDSDDLGRPSRRIFLGSYSLASEGANIVQQMLDDFGEAAGQASNLGPQNPEEGPSSSSSVSTANAVSTASQTRGSTEPQNRINNIKKMISSAKRALNLLESPTAENVASVDEVERNDSTADQTNATQPDNSAGSTTEQDTDTQNPMSSVIGDILDEVMLINERLQPHLVLYQQATRDDTVYRKKSQKLENTNQLCNLVPQTMHYISHIYHNLSDLTIDVSLDPPRRIVAPNRRPTTAIIQQSFPVLQAEISLSGGPLMSTGSLATTSTSTAPPSSTSASDASDASAARSRLMSSLRRLQVSTTSTATPQTSSASSTSSLSSIFPLFLSSSLGNSFMPSAIPPWLSSSISSTSSVSASSSTFTTSTSSSQSAAAVASSMTSSTVETSSRSGIRRGYRRFSEALRSRPSVSVSTHDISGEQGSRHVDPYLMCHSRHFQTNSSTQAGTSTSRNSNQSLSDIISSLVSSIMTTPGESPADVSASGQHGAADDDGLVSTSFTAQFDSPMRALHEHLLDDPDLEEEVISTWHPLDGDSSFVRNIFGASERSNDSARPDRQPRSTTLEDLLNIMGNGPRPDENFLDQLIRCVLDCFSFSDVASVLSGNLAPLSRLRVPLQEFVKSTVLSGEEAVDGNLSSAVDHLVEDLYYHLEEITGETEPLREVDFTASLSSFLRHHLKRIFEMVLKATDEADFGEQLVGLCRQLAIEFVCLCEGCLRNDGFIAFMQSQLFFPFGVHSVLGTWMREQFRNFRRSVLPSPLQADVCERHVVFFQSPDTREPSRTGENITSDEKMDTMDGIPSMNNRPEDSKAESVLPVEKVPPVRLEPSGSSASSSSTPDQSGASPRDRPRPFSRTSSSTRDRDDSLVENLPTKRRRISRCDGQNGLELSQMTNDVQNSVAEPRSSELGTSVQDASLTSASEHLLNGLGVAPPRLPDIDDSLKSEK